MGYVLAWGSTCKPQQHVSSETPSAPLTKVVLALVTPVGGNELEKV